MLKNTLAWSTPVLAVLSNISYGLPLLLSWTVDTNRCITTIIHKANESLSAMVCIELLLEQQVFNQTGKHADSKWSKWNAMACCIELLLALLVVKHLLQMIRMNDKHEKYIFGGSFWSNKCSIRRQTRWPQMSNPWNHDIIFILGLNSTELSQKNIWLGRFLPLSYCLAR